MRLSHTFIILASAFSLLSCSKRAVQAGNNTKNPLEHALRSHAADFDSILSRPDIYEVQIIYTEIQRDRAGRPRMREWRHNVDSSRYFYPASMVKMPLALLALEKINHLQKEYPLLTKDTPYRLDSLRPWQQTYTEDPGAPGGMPSIAHDIRQIFVVSDNLAYNHLFEFLGREYINTTLREKGYTRTGIVHRFNYPGRDNRYTTLMTFYDESGGIYQQDELYDDNTWMNPQYSTTKGRGYYTATDSLVLQPFDMSRKNWFSLNDMNLMLKTVLFPELVDPVHRFDLTPDDYQFLRHYMGIFPRECDYPKYDSTWYDGYVKFFLYGDSKEQRDGKIRIYNKVGEAYGTLTDVAYIHDTESGTEFMLAATILCNQDGIFNDDRYDYDQTGFPFLAKLGKVMLEERKRAISIKK
ncbi:MAG: hypothetical protein RLZ62_1538 [Bacteroidota bacterium]